MTIEFDTLSSIFRMITPAGFVGGVAASRNIGRSDNLLASLAEMLFESPGCGALPYDRLIARVNELASKAGDQNEANELKRVLSIMGPNQTLKLGDRSLTWPYASYDLRQRQLVQVNGTNELFGRTVDDVDELKERPFSIVTINSPMLSPQRRDAERAELFINSVPTIVMSRCVPYVELELVFNRPGDGTSRTQLQSTSLLKFLLGADTTEFAADSANAAMIASRRRVDSTLGIERTTAGMELFTTPQSLMNMDVVPSENRYVDVIDKTRPLASLMSVTIDVKPTVGVYSYKKATVQLKLHDRTRLSEIADLVRPQVYTQTTIWLTYGWRHPFEPDNPYAEFINGNMMRREAFGVQNVQFAFDQSGQVDITLELFTKGSSEVRSAKISQNLKEYSEKLNRLRRLSDRINEYRVALNLDSPRPAGVEVRGVTLLDAAGRAAIPDFALKGKKDEINQAILSLERNLKKNALDPNKVNELVGSIREMYVDKGGGSAYAEAERGLRSAIKTQFEEARTGSDPYLFHQLKDDLRREETSQNVVHPYANIVTSALNEKGNQKVLRRHYASFAKMFSIFIANSIMTIPGVDEVQAFFYQMNSRAGRAAGTNVAEFPVDISVFEDAYKDEIETRGSDSFTIEEFLQLLVRSQIDDMRSIAYGYSSYFEPYNEKTRMATLKKGRDEEYKAALDNVASGLGPFQKPELEIYVETVFASGEQASFDILRAFNTVSGDGASSDGTFKRILRIHVYDKTLNPYEAATKVLSDKRGTFVAASDDWVRTNVLNDQSFIDGIRAGDVDLSKKVRQTQSSAPNTSGKYSGVEIINDGSSMSNKKVKEFVSRYIPSIIYGTNASTVIAANLSTKNDPLLVASQLTGLNKNKRNTMEPNGSGLGGLPLRIIPGQLSMTLQGNPLVNYSQFYFVDFSTGTSVDNVYGVTGLLHSIVPGRFTTEVTFGFYDAYGRFEASSNVLEEIAALTKPIPERR